MNSLHVSLGTYDFRLQAVHKADNSDWSPVFWMAAKAAGNVTPNAPPEMTPAFQFFLLHNSRWILPPELTSE
uniref:Uncharacterized protein n=1 Tax=Romanomermis culicivorax TaxID=13658 RepID=A0A915JAU2_ROMCU